MPASSVVFWDIDGTLVRGSLERLFLKYLLNNGHVTRTGIAAHMLYQALRLPPPKWHHIKLAYLRNQEVGNVETWIQRCWEQTIIDNVFDGACQVVSQLANKGARQVLLSGTLKPFARPLKQHLGIDEIIAAEPEILKHRYTGRLIEPHPHGKHKTLYAGRWLAKNNLAWDTVTALANHVNDRYLLEKAGQAIAVHPDQQLLKIAKRQGWSIAYILN